MSGWDDNVARESSTGRIIYVQKVPLGQEEVSEDSQENVELNYLQGGVSANNQVSRGGNIKAKQALMCKLLIGTALILFLLVSLVVVIYSKEKNDLKGQKQVKRQTPKDSKVHNELNNQNRQPVKEQIPIPPSLNLNYHLFDCVQDFQLFHYFDEKQNMLYFRSRYDLYFPICYANWETLLGRMDIQNWSKERNVIEWGRNNILRGDIVLYDCPKCRNFQEITMLSRFVGQKGELIIFNDEVENCLSKTIDFHQLKNIKFTGRKRGEYGLYNVVISKNQQFFRDQLATDFLRKKAMKVLVKLGKSFSNAEALETIKGNQKMSASKVVLNSSDCKAKIQMQRVDGEEGYYQFIRKDYQAHFQDQSAQLVEKKPIISKMEEEYQQYKKSLPSVQLRKSSDNILSGFPIQMNQILGVSESERQQWSSQKEIVEWVRNRTQAYSVIYYQHRPANMNLFVVLNIAAIVPKGKLLVHCSLESWYKLLNQTARLSVNNIEFIDTPTENEFSSQLIITESSHTIQSITEGRELGSRFVLYYLDDKNDVGKELLFRVYVRHHVRKVGIFPSFFYGYQIFDHFFWYSEHPIGFFEIQRQSYVIFTTWNQPMAQLTQNRKFSLKEMIRVNTPQLKVINPTVLPYFILPEYPLHKAFEFLSAVHKSDYLRSYLLYHYGGGYSDVKHFHYDMLPFFKQLEEGPADKYAVGYHEISPIYPTCVEMPGETACAELKRNYLKIMGAGGHIHKKQSPLTKNYFGRITKILDEKFERLQRFPARDSRDSLGKVLNINGQIIRSPYPLRWQQIDAEVFCRAQWDNFQHYYVNLPFPITYDYK